MKRVIYISIIALFLAASCQTEPGKAEAEKLSTVSVQPDLEKTLIVPWTVELNDSTKLMEIRKNPAADLSNLSPQDMVDALNLKYPQIKLEWVKQDGNKGFVAIADATFLTQQSGTQGARAYLAEATFSLTELKDIHAIEFSFKEGDHARPGVYSRDNFKGFN